MKPIIQGELDALSRRSSALESDVAALKSRQTTRALSGTIDAGLISLSGSVDGRFNQLSGTVDARFISLSGSVDSAWKAGDATLSGTINARFVSLSGSVDSAWKAGDATLSGTTNARFISLSGSVDSAWKAGDAALSGTVDAARSWNGLDALRGTYKFEDYIGTAQDMGSGGGGGTAALQTFESGHPGIVRMTVTTSGTDYGHAFISDALLLGLPALGGGPIEYEACVRIPTSVDNGTNNAARIIGFTQYINVPLNGVYFEVNRSRYGDNEFRFVTAATGSRVVQRTGVTVVANQWYRLRVNAAPDGNVMTGSIFSTGSLISQATSQTYIPTAGTFRNGVFINKFLGASSVFLDCDYQYYQQTITGSRI